MDLAYYSVPKVASHSHGYGSLAADLIPHTLPYPCSQALPLAHAYTFNSTRITQRSYAYAGGRAWVWGYSSLLVQCI